MLAVWVLYTDACKMGYRHLPKMWRNDVSEQLDQIVYIPTENRKYRKDESYE